LIYFASPKNPGYNLIMKKILIGLAILISLGCGTSAKMRETLRNRENAINKTGLYCGSFPGESLEEDEIALNLKMAEKCDPARPFSIMTYESHEPKGIMYCCSTDPAKKIPPVPPTPSPSPLPLSPHTMPHLKAPARPAPAPHAVTPAPSPSTVAQILAAPPPPPAPAVTTTPGVIATPAVPAQQTYH
jgi:hypothetical protein